MGNTTEKNTNTSLGAPKQRNKYMIQSPDQELEEKIAKTKIIKIDKIKMAKLQTNAQRNQASIFFLESFNTKTHDALCLYLPEMYDLNNISLIFCPNFQMNQVFIQFMELASKYFAKIPSVSIHFSKNTFDQRANSYPATRIIECFSYAKSLSLSYEKEFENDIISEQLQSASKLQEITKLSIHAPECSSFTSDEIVKLAECIKGWEKLVDFEISLHENSKISDNQIRLLMNGLETKKNSLIRLSLDFQDCQYVDAASLAIISEQLRLFSKLNTFELKLRESRLSSQSLNYLSSAIIEAVSLTEITIEIPKCSQNINSSDLKALIDCLKLKQGLQTIRLDFSHCSILSINHYSTLFETLKNNWQELKKLSLKFEECLEDVDTFIFFLCEVSNVQSELQHLTIQLDHQETPPSEKPILSFFSTLKGLVFLKELEIGFFRKSSLTSEVLQYINNSLTKLKYLNSVNLNMIDQSVSAIEIGELFNNFTLLDNLIKLKINIQNSYSLNDECVSRIFQAIPSLKALTELKLEIQNCKNVTEKSLKEFSKAIEDHNQLNSLHFNAEHCGTMSLSSDTKTDIRLSVKYLTLIEKSVKL